MKKRRLVVMICVLFVLCLALSLSSTLFQLQCVKIRFKGEQTEEFCSNDNITKIISSTKFEYGQLLFNQPKAKYIENLEQNNPNLRVESIEAVFPNTLLITASERVGKFYMVENDKIFIMDREFKILKIGRNLDVDGLTKLKFESSNKDEQTFFDFFEVSSFAYDVGQFLEENNLVFVALNCFSNLFELYGDSNYIVSQICFKMEAGDVVNLTLSAKSPYGIKLEIKNILNKFENKFKKLLTAFSTLLKREKIKTTYGTLKIEDNLNCFWMER